MKKDTVRNMQAVTESVREKERKTERPSKRECERERELKKESARERESGRRRGRRTVVCQAGWLMPPGSLLNSRLTNYVWNPSHSFAQAGECVSL